MDRHLFQSITNKNGLIGIKNNDQKVIVGLYYCSPNASYRSNVWLEKRLIKLYTKYYLRVSFETVGQFWNKFNTPIKISGENDKFFKTKVGETDDN